MSPIKLIVGLRNPGDKYSGTRHNAGAWWVQDLALQKNCVFKKNNKCYSECTLLADEEIILALPNTYMNQSGLAVRSLSDYYKIKCEEILIVHDELDLPVGKIKLKISGGHGGHNGLKDIINQLHTNNFNRLRIGIGHPGDKSMVLNYVLHTPSKSDAENISQAINNSFNIISLLKNGDLMKAMNSVNAP